MLSFALVLAAASPMARVFAQAAGEVSMDKAASFNSSSDPCSDPQVGSYNLSFHIAGIFIVLIVSGCGMFGALYLGSSESSIIVNRALLIFKMFGTGVIAATAWIHLLPDAFSQFSSPCLQGYWNEYGTNYVGLFGMSSAFMVQLVEMAVGAHDDPSQASSSTPIESETGIDIVIGSLAPSEAAPTEPYVIESSDKLSKLAQRLRTIVLECGILTHSVIIGITLGVTPDDRFTSLLIALCFHQAFEGMALGALLAGTDLPRRSQALLGALYPLTAPLGVALGVGLHASYREGSQAAILAQGVLGSLSAGILIYNTYAELIGAQINRGPAFRAGTPRLRAAGLLAMYAGAAAMAVVGVWA